MSPRVIITLIIILGIGVGCGSLVFGILLAQQVHPEAATFASIGAAVLSASVAALLAHLAGGFRDLGDDQ